MHIDDEVTARTAKARVAFGRHRRNLNVWERNGIRLDPKLKVYKAVVQLSCLRRLLEIRWQDKIPRYRGQEEGSDAKRTYSFKACTNGLAMSQECLMSSCQRKFSMKKIKKEITLKVAKRTATKTHLRRSAANDNLFKLFFLHPFLASKIFNNTFKNKSNVGQCGFFRDTSFRMDSLFSILKTYIILLNFHFFHIY